MLADISRIARPAVVPIALDAEWSWIPLVTPGFAFAHVVVECGLRYETDNTYDPRARFRPTLLVTP